MGGLVQFVESISAQVSLVAWALFLVTWSIGWALRGTPIPFSRIKRTGQSLIEDAVWAAFWLAMGSLVFTITSYLARVLQSSIVGGG